VHQAFNHLNESLSQTNLGGPREAEAFAISLSGDKVGPECLLIGNHCISPPSLATTADCNPVLFSEIALSISLVFRMGKTGEG
jgi:hypothetical protein